MPKKKGKSFRVLFTRPALLFAVIFLVIGGWLTYRTISSPLGINELSVFDEKNSKVVTSQIGAICAQVYGHCLGYDNQCVTYTDSCVQAKVCAQPYKSCNEPVPTRAPLGAPATPPPGCISWFDGCNTCKVAEGGIMACTKIACKMAESAPPRCLVFSSAMPTPTAVPTRTPMGTPFTSPKPTPTSPSTLGSVSTFSATNPCGVSSFKTYSFSCKNGTKTGLDFGTCLPIDQALLQIQQACGAKR